MLKINTGILFFSLLFLYGCTSNNSVNSPNTSLSPNVGSTFTSYFYRMDSTGNIKTGSDKITTATFLQTGITFGGQTNVSEIQNQDEGFGPKTTGYLQYDISGDISTYHASSFFQTIPDTLKRHDGWLRFPVHSLGMTTVVSIDTIYHGRHIFEEQTVLFIGTDIVTVNSESLSCAKFLRVVASTNLTDGSSSADSTYQWVSPKLGYIVRSEPVSIKFNHDVSRVTSYSLH